MYVQAFSGAGLNTLQATNAESALQAAKLKPTVIVADLQLGSERDALTLCEKLKQDSATKDIPFVIVTGASNEPLLRKRADAVGCAAVWLKPVDPLLLVAEVLQILRLTADDASSAALMDRPPTTS